MTVTPNEQTPQNRGGLLAWASFLVPLAVSLAANTVWGIQSGSDVFLVAGLVTPLLLVLAVERFQAMPGLTGWARAIQVVGMTVVAAVAALWSWVHTTALLLEQRVTVTPLETALCVVAPLAVDGLAVLSVLTIRPREAAAVRATEADAEGDAWGGPESVTADEADDEPTAEPVTPTPLRPHPPRKPRTKRTRAELVTAGKALTPTVTRKATESTDDFRRRVERAERDARSVTDRTEVPA